MGAIFGKRSSLDRASMLHIPEDVLDAVVRHLRQCLPFEGVGFLATSKLSPRMVAQRFYPGRNIDLSPMRYTMDPADVLSAMRDMELRRMRLLAIVHSHPDTPPVPSVSDLAEAKIPGVLSLIVGFSPVVDLRAWHIVFGDDGIAVRSEEVEIGECCERRKTARFRSTRR